MPARGEDVRFVKPQNRREDGSRAKVNRQRRGKEKEKKEDWRPTGAGGKNGKNSYEEKARI